MLITLALSDFRLSMIADRRADNTVRWYIACLSETAANPIDWLNDMGITSLESVDTKTMREYVVWLRDQRHSKTNNPLSQSTINSYIRSIHRFFSWCTDEYEIPNPMKRIAFPKDTPAKPKAIDFDDLRAMLDGCGVDLAGIRNRAILMFLIDTGARVGGLVKLTIDDVDFGARYATVTEKGNKTRRVRFSESTCEVMQVWKAIHAGSTQAFFYNSKTEEPLTTDGVRVIIGKLGKAAKVKGRVNPHSFRHAFAREYLTAGGDLATLSVLMGHVLPQTTVNSYARFTEQELAERFDRFAPTNRLTKKED